MYEGRGWGELGRHERDGMVEYGQRKARKRQFVGRQSCEFPEIVEEVEKEP